MPAPMWPSPMKPTFMITVLQTPVTVSAAVNKRACLGLQQLHVDRQRTYAPAGRCVDRVADRGRGGRYAGLADTRRRSVAVHQVDAGIRRDVDPRHLIRIEIALFDPALLRADIAVKGVADRHDR